MSLFRTGFLLSLMLAGVAILVMFRPQVAWAGGPRTVGEATSLASITGRVAAGTEHTCAIKADGSLVCWGRNDKGQATPPPGVFLEAGAGYAQSCALRDDGVPWGLARRPGLVCGPRRCPTGRGRNRLWPAVLERGGTVALSF